MTDIIMNTFTANEDTKRLLSTIHLEDYCLEPKELAVAGAIKFKLEQLNTVEAFGGLSNPVELFQEISDTITVDDLGTGNIEYRQKVLDYLKSIHPEQIMENASAGFKQFIADCKQILGRRLN